ncbi:MAG: NAD(P)/FAD-dependent oxidoreductase [Verrucomicrobiales bacterium]
MVESLIQAGSSDPVAGNDPSRQFDVVIIGGAFSGAAMGILLRRALPDATIAIVERSEKFDRKVGESTSEVAGCFLTQVLHLSTYLSQKHIAKNGLRMWFTDAENACMGQCSEIGGRLQTRLPGFQLDRAELDPHLLKMAEEAGCEIFRPATVRGLELGGAGRNAMTIDVRDGGSYKVTAKWVVDASGKAAVIPRLRGTLESMEEEHPTTAVWARFRNVRDLDGHDICTRFPDLGQHVLSARGTATNHLMGRGWWCWIIPLRDGDVSAGVTFDRRIFQLPEGGTLTERLHKHLLSHPVGRELFADAVPVEKDTRTYSQLAYRSREVAGDGWFVVGDAGGFMDPMYSQGLDYCAHTVYATHVILVDALKGECVKQRAIDYGTNFAESYQQWFEALYKGKYRYMGDADLMFTAFLLDLCMYFVGPVRLVYTDTVGEFSRLPYQGPAGRRVARFMAFYNQRLAELADQRLATGDYGRHNLGERFIVKQGLAPGAALVPLFLRAMTCWGRAELHGLLSRWRSPAGAQQAPAASTITKPPTGSAAESPAR